MSLMILDKRTGQKIEISGKLILGRTEGDIKFPTDPSVSRKHLEIHVIQEGVVRITCLSTRNVVVVDGVNIEPGQSVTVGIGSSILFGAQQLQLLAPSASAPIALPSAPTARPPTANPQVPTISRGGAG